MKPQVKVTLDLGIEEVVLNFTDTEDIDRLIEVLNTARAELEHQIEMKRIKNREKRKRRKERINFDNLVARKFIRKGPEEVKKTGDDSEATIKMYKELKKEYDEIFKFYDNLLECKLKDDLKPYVELSKVLLEAVKND